MGNSCMGQCKILVQMDGLLEHLQGVVHVFAPRVAAAAQIEIVGLCVFGRLEPNRLFFLRRQCNAQGLGDAARDFVLDDKDILELSVVTLSPHRMPRRTFDELRCNAETISRAPDGPFEHEGGPKLLPYLWRRGWSVAK